MMTFAIATSTPLTGTIVIPGLGMFLGWLMIAVLVLSLAALLPMIFASIYAGPVDGDSKRRLDRIDFTPGLAHRGAA